MFGTRLRFRKAPATDAEQPRALIVAHGQPSNPAPAEAALARLAARAQAFLPDIPISSATMANPGMLERAINRLPENERVYPFFMVDGWFVKTALPKRLEDFPLHVMSPLGLDPALPDIAAKMAHQAIEQIGWTVRDAHILLAAHGSAHGNAAARSVRLFADHLAARLPRTGITIGFLEEEPFLAGVAAGLQTRSICMPFFAMQGDHVRDDIPSALSNAGFTGPVLPPFSEYDDVARLIADRLHAEMHERCAA